MADDVIQRGRAPVVVNAIPTPETLPDWVRRRPEKYRRSWLNAHMGLNAPTQLRLGKLTVGSESPDWRNFLVAELVEDLLWTVRTPISARDKKKRGVTAAVAQNVQGNAFQSPTDVLGGLYALRGPFSEAWEEGDHPREPEGGSVGGRFAGKGSDGGDSAEKSGTAAGKGRKPSSPNRGIKRFGGYDINLSRLSKLGVPAGKVKAAGLDLARVWAHHDLTKGEEGGMRRKAARELFDAIGIFVGRYPKASWMGGLKDFRWTKKESDNQADETERNLQSAHRVLTDFTGHDASRLRDGKLR